MEPRAGLRAERQAQEAMPEREALLEPLASHVGIRAVAEALGTSPRATLECLDNLGWLDEFERDMLRGTSIDDESV